MNKSMMIGVATGVAAAAGAGAVATVATGKLSFGGPAYASVVSVTPVSQTITTPRQQCHTEQVTVRKRSGDAYNIAGTALGAVVGGVVFNQIGGGVFRALATTAGVIGGGYAGNRIENSIHKGNTKTVARERCVTAYDQTTVPNGYQVSYTYKGKTEVVHLDHDPGRQLLLTKDGKVDLNAYSQDRSGQQGPNPLASPNAAPAPANGSLSPANGGSFSPANGSLSPASPYQEPNANQSPIGSARPG